MSIIVNLSLAAVAALGIGLSAPAAAGDRHGHRHGHHAHKHHAHNYHAHPYRHAYGHRYYPEAPGYVVREHVVVERPIYVSPPAYYYAPPPRYPGVVVSVNIPPIVFPIR